MKRIYLLPISLLPICTVQVYSMELTKDRKCKSEQSVHKPVRVTKERKSVSLDGLFTKEERLSKRLFLKDLCLSPVYLKYKGWNELHIAVQKKDINEIQQIFKEHKGIDLPALLNTPDKEGNTPLWLAVLEYSFTDGDKFIPFIIIQMLVKAGACVNVKNNEEWELLNWVSKQGLSDVLAVLLTSKIIDVNRRDIGGITPLVAGSWSPKKGRRKTLKTLVKAHANVEDLKGSTANPEALVDLPDQQQDHMHDTAHVQPKKFFKKSNAKKNKK